MRMWNSGRSTSARKYGRLVNTYESIVDGIVGAGVRLMVRGVCWPVRGVKG